MKSGLVWCGLAARAGAAGTAGTGIWDDGTEWCGCGWSAAGGSGSAADERLSADERWCSGMANRVVDGGCW